MSLWQEVRDQSLKNGVLNIVGQPICTCSEVLKISIKSSTVKVICIKSVVLRIHRSLFHKYWQAVQLQSLIKKRILKYRIFSRSQTRFLNHHYSEESLCSAKSLQFQILQQPRCQINAKTCVFSGLASFLFKSQIRAKTCFMNNFSLRVFEVCRSLQL